MAGDDLGKLFVAVLGTVDEGLPRRPHERLELLDRRPAELRGGLFDEVGPELAGAGLPIGLVRWRREIDEVFDEAERLETAGPRRLRGEHDPVAVLA